MLSYLKRYIFGLLVPVAATEADDDGQRAAKGLDEDESSQAAILEAKRKEREESKAKAREVLAEKGKKEGRYNKVESLPVEEKALSDAGLAPSEPEKINSEPPAEPPPTIPQHIQELIMMLDEAGIAVDKFVTWATSPRPKEGKGRLLPEGTKIESFSPDFVKAVTVTSKWSKIIAQLK